VYGERYNHRNIKSRLARLPLQNIHYTLTVVKYVVISVTTNILLHAVPFRSFQSPILLVLFHTTTFSLDVLRVNRYLSITIWTTELIDFRSNIDVFLRRLADDEAICL